jgi:hypothetical protein
MQRQDRIRVPNNYIYIQPPQGQIHNQVALQPGPIYISTTKCAKYIYVPRYIYLRTRVLFIIGYGQAGRQHMWQQQSPYQARQIYSQAEPYIGQQSRQQVLVVVNWQPSPMVAWSGFKLMHIQGSRQAHTKPSQPEPIYSYGQGLDCCSHGQAEPVRAEPGSAGPLIPAQTQPQTQSPLNPVSISKPEPEPPTMSAAQASASPEPAPSQDTAEPAKAVQSQAGPGRQSPEAYASQGQSPTSQRPYSPDRASQSPSDPSRAPKARKYSRARARAAQCVGSPGPSQARPSQSPVGPVRASQASQSRQCQSKPKPEPSEPAKAIRAMEPDKPGGSGQAEIESPRCRGSPDPVSAN